MTASLGKLHRVGGWGPNAFATPSELDGLVARVPRVACVALGNPGLFVRNGVAVVLLRGGVIPGGNAWAFYRVNAIVGWGMVGFDCQSNLPLRVLASGERLSRAFSAWDCRRLDPGRCSLELAHPGLACFGLSGQRVQMSRPNQVTVRMGKSQRDFVRTAQCCRRLRWGSRDQSGFNPVGIAEGFGQPCRKRSPLSGNFIRLADDPGRGS